jgi:hypothetical protein
MNLQKKVDEMKTLILSPSGDDEQSADGTVTDCDYFPWLAQYLVLYFMLCSLQVPIRFQVMKRVSIEHNFHHLYGNFLSTFESDVFERICLNETFRNIRVGLKEFILQNIDPV